EWQPRFWARLIVLVVLAAYVLGFILENRKQGHLHFVLFTAKVSLIWLILWILAIGIVAGALVRHLRRRRRPGERCQTGDTLLAPGGRCEAEGESCRVGPATEVDARDEGDSRTARAAEELRRHGAGQLEPEEVAAGGMRPAGAAVELALERVEHRV